MGHWAVDEVTKGVGREKVELPFELSYQVIAICIIP